jgi:DNA topoisomerase-1
VQSVATKLVVEREREIQKFVPEESWKIQAYVHGGDMRFPIEFLRIDGKPKKLKDHTDTAKFFSTLGIDIESVPTSVDKK